MLRSLLLLICALNLVGCQRSDAPFRGTEMEGLPAPAITLTDQFGEPFRIDDHRGRLVVVAFGYIHCPDVCPTTLSTWGRVQEALGQLSSEVTFAMVTVDPQRDTPDKLADHVAIFGDDSLGLYGSDDELAAVYEEYAVFHEKIAFDDSAVGYIVDHSTRMYVIDRAGNLRLRFGFDTPAADIAEDLKRILSE